MLAISARKIRGFAVRSLHLALLGLVCLTFATRLPALLHPLPIDDEHIYSVVANEIIDGGKPYLDAVERKPPLLFYTYAAIYSVAGKYNWHALHLVAILWTLATMAGLYVIGRELFDVPTGLIAALLYALFQPAVSFKNIQFNGELLMNLPIVWAWAIAFAAGQSGRKASLFLAGMLGCVGFLLKQPAAIASVPLGLYLLLPGYRRSRGLTRADALRHFTIFAAGFWITLSVMGVLLYEQGTLRAAIYWTIEDHASPHFSLSRFLRSTLIFVATSLPLLLGAAWSRNFWLTKQTEWVGLIMLAAASAVGTAAGGRFYSHYYIQLLPAFVLLAAPVFRQLSLGKASSRASWVLVRVLTPIWLVLTVIVFPVVRWHELSQRRELSEVGRYLAEHFQPNERLFVWGQDPGIYLEARMRPACRYVATFPLTGYIFGGPIKRQEDTRNRILPGAWDNLREDFARHPPVCIVDVQKTSADHPTEYAIADFPILQRLMEQDYVFEARTAEGLIYRRRPR